MVYQGVSLVNISSSFLPPSTPIRMMMAIVNAIPEKRRNALGRFFVNLFVVGFARRDVFHFSSEVARTA